MLLLNKTSQNYNKIACIKQKPVFGCKKPKHYGNRLRSDNHLSKELIQAFWEAGLPDPDCLPHKDYYNDEKHVKEMIEYLKSTENNPDWKRTKNVPK